MVWKVGSVPYVNAAPLLWGLAEVGVEVVLAVPARLPALLEAGEVDAVLVSSIHALLNPGLRMVRPVGIASFGPVTSVKVFSRVPLHDVQSLALDASSLTSNRLALEVLAARGSTPRTVPMPPDLGAMLEECDAAVLIGDLGMTAHLPGLREYDLGEEWATMTGLPFLWAGWVGGESLSAELASVLTRAGWSSGCGAGVPETAAMRSVVGEASAQSGIAEPEVERYLATTMTYRLTAKVEAGYEEFARRIRAPHRPLWVG